MIGKLYALEKKIKDQSPDEKYRIRQEFSKPIFEKLYAWLEEHKVRVVPKTLLGKAIQYALNEKKNLEQYWKKASWILITTSLKTPSDPLRWEGKIGSSLIVKLELGPVPPLQPH